MAWPYLFQTNFGPSITIDGTSGSFLYSHTASDQYIRPIKRDENVRLHAANKGYNGRVIMPSDKRYDEHWSFKSNLTSSISFSQAHHVPTPLLMEYDLESRQVCNSNVGFDNTIVDLMDVGKLLSKNNGAPSNAIAFSTGCERTNIAISMLADSVVEAYSGVNHTTSVQETIRKVHVPDLGPAYLYHTKSPVQQLNILNHRNTRLNNHDPLSVLLIRTSSKVSILKAQYTSQQYDSCNIVHQAQLDHLYSINLLPSSDVTISSLSNTVSHVSLCPTASKLAEIGSNGSLAVYSVSEGDGKSTRSEFSKRSLPNFVNGNSHSSWQRVFWAEGNMLLTGNRYAVSTYDIREQKYSPADCFFDFEFKGGSLISVSDICPSPLSSSEFFAVVDRKLLWLDLRYTKRPILSVDHFFNSDDPTLKIDAAFEDSSNSLILTLSSQLSPLAAVYRFGRDNDNLPFLFNEPSYYSLHPEFTTQTLRTVPVQSTIGSAKDFAVFQYSRDFGLVQHVLTTDPTVSVDLHDKYSPSLQAVDGSLVKYHESLLKMTRGMKNEENHPKQLLIRDARPLVHLVSDFDQILPTSQHNAPESDLEIPNTRMKILRKFHERATLPLSAVVDSNYLFDNTSSDFTSFVQSLKESNKTININSRLDKINNILYDSEVKSLDELTDYFSKLWIEPLRGHALSKPLLRATGWNLKDRRIKRGGNTRHSFKRVKRDRRVVYVPPPKESDTKFQRLRAYRQRPVIISKRSVDYKHPCYIYGTGFLARRKKIISLMARDVALSYVTVSVKKNLNADMFVDVDLGVLRKYTNSFDTIGLSNDTKEILSVWPVKESIRQSKPVAAAASSWPSGSQTQNLIRPGKARRGQSVNLRNASQLTSFSGLSQTQAFTQSQTQSQGFGASQSASQRKRKKKKTKEGFF